MDNIETPFTPEDFLGTTTGLQGARVRLLVKAADGQLMRVSDLRTDFFFRLGLDTPTPVLPEMYCAVCPQARPGTTHLIETPAVVASLPPSSLSLAGLPYAGSPQPHRHRGVRRRKSRVETRTVQDIRHQVDSRLDSRGFHHRRRRGGVCTWLGWRKGERTGEGRDVGRPLRPVIQGKTITVTVLQSCIAATWVLVERYDMQ